MLVFCCFFTSGKVCMYRLEFGITKGFFLSLSLGFQHFTCHCLCESPTLEAHLNSFCDHYLFLTFKPKVATFTFMPYLYFKVLPDITTLLKGGEHCRRVKRLFFVPSFYSSSSFFRFRIELLSHTHAHTLLLVYMRLVLSTLF